MRFRTHAILFVATNLVLHAGNFVTGAPWWAFWPLVLWGFALGTHFMVYRSRRSDEGWTKARTDDVLSKSYDRAHIDAIAKDRRDE